VAVAPDGDLLLADQGDNSVRRVGSALPGFAGTDIALASVDGSELYRFDANGRHLRTLDALTGATLFRFTYDAADGLAQVEEGEEEGNLTTIERDADRGPVALVAPDGQRTEVTLDPEGYLATVTNPAGESVAALYRPDGLLRELTDPRGNAHRFEYEDATGRLRLDADAGGSSAFARADTDEGFGVTSLSALLREERYQVERLPTGGEQRVNSCCGGVAATEQIATDGSRTITSPDGTATRLEFGPDPRWGMQAPLDRAVTVTTPGGHMLKLATEDEVRLADSANPLSAAILKQALSETWSGPACRGASERKANYLPSGRPKSPRR
jgi:YD repeat-containing protein